MKALSVRMPWAHLIAEGIKTVETRSWSTKYRGPLLICAWKAVAPGSAIFVKDGRVERVTPYSEQELGHAICTVELVGCTTMAEEHEAAVLVRCRPGLYAWRLENVRKLEPFPVVGKQGFFEVHGI